MHLLRVYCRYVEVNQSVWAEAELRCWQKWAMPPLGPNKITGIYARLEPISCTPRLEDGRNAAIADPPARPTSIACRNGKCSSLFSSSAFYLRRTTRFMIRLAVQILVKMTYQTPRICVHVEHLYLGKITPPTVHS